MSNNNTFDYTVAGGATAGLVATSLLTGDPSVSILVAEHGH